METGRSGLRSTLIDVKQIDAFDSHTKTGTIVVVFSLVGCLSWWFDIGGFYLLDTPPIRTNQRWRDLLALTLWPQTGCIKIA